MTDKWAGDLMEIDGCEWLPGLGAGGWRSHDGEHWGDVSYCRGPSHGFETMSVVPRQVWGREWALHEG